MAIIYVSNTVSNGYGGTLAPSDGNNGLTPGSPKLTINGAHTAASASDSIYVNPTATPYAENSGSGYLSLTKAITVQTDPALLLTVGKAILTMGVATNRSLNMNGSNITFRDFIIDNSTGTTAAITTQVQTGLYVYNVTFKNVGAGNAGVSMGSAGTQAVVVEKCVMTSANGNNATSHLVKLGAIGANGQITIKGCSVNGIYGFINVGANGATARIQVGLATDGTRNTCVNCQAGVRIPGTGPHAVVDIQYIDFSLMTDATVGYVIWDNQDSANSIASLTIQNNTYSGTQSKFAFIVGSTTAADISSNVYTAVGNCTFVDFRNVGALNVKVHGNTCTVTGGNVDVIGMSSVGTGAEVYSNTVNSDNTTGHLITVGGDGQNFNTYNYAAATGQQNLGDIAGNKYLYGRFKNEIQARQFNIRAASCVRAFFRKSGTPNGTVLAKFYTDNAGVPGTLIDTSADTLTAAALTSSQFVEFTLPLRVLMSYDTFYHVRFEFTGTIDGVNYFQVDYNANVGTTGSGFNKTYEYGTSADGITWTPQAARALRIGVGLLPGGDLINPLVHSNILTDTNTSANVTLTHNIIVNGTQGARVYRNQVYGGGIGIIMKLMDGTVNPVVVYDNLVYFFKGDANAGQALRDKGSKQARFYHNVAIVNGVAAKCANIDADYVATGDNFFPAIGGQKSVGTEFKNNILYRDGGTYAGYVFEIGFSTGANSVTGLVSDYNAAYVGTNTTLASNGTTGTAVNNNQAQWQANGYGINGVYTNPLLGSITPSSSAQFAPAFTSPAKSAGTSVWPHVKHDYSLTTLFGFPPTIGAYELVAGSLPTGRNASFVSGIGPSI